MTDESPPPSTPDPEPNPNPSPLIHPRRVSFEHGLLPIQKLVFADPIQTLAPVKQKLTESASNNRVGSAAIADVLQISGDHARLVLETLGSVLHSESDPLVGAKPEEVDSVGADLRDLVLFLYIQSYKKLLPRTHKDSAAVADVWPSTSAFDGYLSALSPIQLVRSNSRRFMPSQADDEAHQLSYLQKHVSNIVSLLAEPVEGEGEESLVLSMEAFEHLGFLVQFGDKGSDVSPLSQATPFFANSDPDMPAVPVPASQVHDWLLQNIASALESIAERISGKENGPSNASDQDDTMSDASAAPDKVAPSGRGPCLIEGVSKTSLVKQASDLRGRSVKVVNCHDSVIYLLAPLRYATVHGCSDTTIVLGAVGKALRVEHCERVHVIAASKRVCIANCRECVFFLGVNQRPLIVGDNHKLQLVIDCLGSSIEREYGFKKQEQLKNPKYIEMRMDELYPVKKARPWIHSGKDISKENGVKEQSSNLFNVSLLADVAATKRQQLCREDNDASTEVSNDTNTEARPTNERCSQSMFRSVTELSTRGEELSYLPDIDMTKALKGLATYAPLSVHPDDISGKSDTASLSGNFVYEFHVPGREIPLDFSMKTYVRLVSSSPLNWLHRSIMGSTYNSMPELKSLSCNAVNQDKSSGSGSAVVSQVLNSMSLHSWVYPQSTLPPFIISALITSGPDRGEDDFLQKRQLAWEDAFRSLYFMFRKNLCKIFYVCTSQFVAMFTGSCESGGVKRSCNAYITQSTRRLRAMLKDLDICYSMPLCKTKIDETTVEDLAELSEIENHNLGQARRLRSVSNIDNTPESFLAFEGNESVHGVYDLLLNFRSSLGFLLTADVPVLYSPVPFQNAALSSPEIKCTEMVKADDTSCCMVEVKGEYLPPWIISNICANVGANGQNFEASFVTEPTSVSLNMGLPQIPEKTEPETSVTEGTGETKDGASGIPGAVICLQLQAGYLKSLKYCNNLNTVSVSLSPS